MGPKLTFNHVQAKGFHRMSGSLWSHFRYGSEADLAVYTGRVCFVPLTDIRRETRSPTRGRAFQRYRRRLRCRRQDGVDLGEHCRGRNRALDRKWAEIREDKAAKRKAALTKAGESTKSN